MGASEEAHQLTWAAVQGYDLSAEVAGIDQRVLVWWGEDRKLL